MEATCRGDEMQKQKKETAAEGMGDLSIGGLTRDLRGEGRERLGRKDGDQLLSFLHCEGIQWHSLRTGSQREAFSSASADQAHLELRAMKAEIGRDTPCWCWSSRSRALPSAPEVSLKSVRFIAPAHVSLGGLSDPD